MKINIRDLKDQSLEAKKAPDSPVDMLKSVTGMKTKTIIYPNYATK